MSTQERPLKVLRIIDRLIYGGPTRNVVFLTEGLARRGFDCDLITGLPAKGEGDMTFWAKEYGVHPIIINQMSRELGPRDAVVMWKLFRLFQKLRPDIIHTHKSKAGAAGRLAGFFYKWCSPSILKLQPRKVRMVHTFHGHIFHSYYGKFKTSVFIHIERVLALITDRIVTVSEQQTDEICNVFRIGKTSAFRVIPLGVDFCRTSTRSVFRQQSGIDEEEFLVAAVGRLCEVKNFSLLIQAFARALKADPKFKAKLAFIGDGHLRPQLEMYARDLAVEHSVIFAGFQSDVDALYPSFDVAALSSLNEGTPLTLIESMSHGRPVLTTEVGGYGDILGSRVRASDGFTIWDHGISVPSGNIGAYASALLFLAANPSLRGQMGEKARAYVHREFSRERLVSDMASLYSEMWEAMPAMQRTGRDQKMKAVGGGFSSA